MQFEACSNPSSCLLCCKLTLSLQNAWIQHLGVTVLERGYGGSQRLFPHTCGIRVEFLSA